jgi:hypothetical protein
MAPGWVGGSAPWAGAAAAARAARQSDKEIEAQRLMVRVPGAEVEEAGWKPSQV